MDLLFLVNNLLLRPQPQSILTTDGTVSLHVQKTFEYVVLRRHRKTLTVFV